MQSKSNYDSECDFSMSGWCLILHIGFEILKMSSNQTRIAVLTCDSSDPVDSESMSSCSNESSSSLDYSSSISLSESSEVNSSNVKVLRKSSVSLSSTSTSFSSTSLLSSSYESGSISPSLDLFLDSSPNPKKLRRLFQVFLKSSTRLD